MKKNLLTLAVAIIIALVIAEVLLRSVFHLIPGRHTYSQWFTPVDTLILLKGFTADSNGIFKVDPQAAEFLHNRCDSFGYNHPTDKLDNVTWEIYGLDRDYRELADPGFHNTFADYLRSLQKKDTALRDDFENAVLDFSIRPINGEGFRSIAFKNYTAKRKKILLLGDSFTWGHSTKNKTASFADILLSQGYIVYNTGISGADVPQYAAVLQKYIDTLRPDYVVVNFFMGNDVAYVQREVKPCMPVFYCTNSTNLLSCPNGIYFNTPKEAYHFAYSQLYIPTTGFFNKLCRLTAVGTLGWKAIEKVKFSAAHGFNTPHRHYDLPEYRAYWKKVDSLTESIPVCNRQLIAMEQLCRAKGARFVLIAIPEVKRKNLITPSSIAHLMEGIPYYVPANLTLADYDLANGHYNEQGQQKHADFIRQIIEAAN